MLLPLKFSDVTLCAPQYLCLTSGTFLFYFVSLAFYPKQKTKWLARGCKSICLRLLSAVNFYREM